MRKDTDPQKFTKTHTDNAGETLRLGFVSESEISNALEVLSNWRASHIYPMHIFRKRLERVSKSIDQRAISAQRLKRVPSIIKKLNRNYDGKRPTMKLTQMQDIAGCRAIMPTNELTTKLYEEFFQASKNNIKHLKINEKNYVLNPKPDGYRSIHLVYRFISDKGKAKYNGLLVEVQLRSRLQHIWSTAVETVDFFTGQAIKSNQGVDEWAKFFQLVSSAFAIKENTPLVPGTPSDKKALYQEIMKMEKSLSVISKMQQWTNSVRVFEDVPNKGDFHYFLLELDTKSEKLTISSFSKRSELQAIEAYAKAEKKIYSDKAYDVVLVGADTIADLKSTYPNYFIDTRLFIKEIESIIAKASST